MRFDPLFLALIDADAKTRGITRTDWLELAGRSLLGMSVVGQVYPAGTVQTAKHQKPPRDLMADLEASIAEASAARGFPKLDVEPRFKGSR